MLVEFDGAEPLAAITQRLKRIVRGDGATSQPTPPQGPTSNVWHAVPFPEVMRALEVGPDGLDHQSAELRAQRYGKNVLPKLKAPSRWGRLVEQFQSLPVILLAAAAGLSVATGGIADAVVILGVVGLNAAVGYATESRTSRIIGALSLPLQTSVPIRREGRIELVSTTSIVPGDLLVLRPGVVVAADARITEANLLSTDESMLTGESLPVVKSTALVAAKTPLSERASMVYRSTVVVGGSGLAVAVATGGRTEAGGIQALVGSAQTPETPLQRQLDQLGRQLVGVSLATCAVVFAIGLLRGQGLVTMLTASIALAVSAVPEGLPTVGTTALALGIDKMRRESVLVRRLRAIETLAAVDVVAFDKTGTLTENRMSAAAVACERRYLTVGGGALWEQGAKLPPLQPASPLTRLLEMAALCSEATIEPAADGRRLSGSPTEVALLRLGIDLGIDIAASRQQHPLRTLSYRSEGRQYMLSVHAAPEGTLIACKGNPEQVLALCTTTLRNGRHAALTARARARIAAANRRMAGDGLRVLGFAYAERSGAWDESAAVNDLVWLGLVGLADPTRRGTAEHLLRFDRAGIRVIMLTGDQAATAGAVARRLHLANGAPVTTLEAGQLQAADDRTVAKLVQQSRIFARATPADKLRITQALQRLGRIVAVTGDGINDSPALRAANVGIVMGRSGTEAAREVADVVLASDDIGAMLSALALGRTTYANIRKAIHFLLATNLSEILVMLAATALGFRAILSPLQLLWINLLSDVAPALGLALDPAESGVLDRAPFPADRPIIGRAEIGTLAREGTVIAAGALGAYGISMARHGDVGRAGTTAFSSLVGAQLLHALTARSTQAGIFGGQELPPNRTLAAALASSAALQIAVLTVPALRGFLGLAPLGIWDVVAGLAGAGLPYLANEAAKLRSMR